MIVIIKSKIAKRMPVLKNYVKHVFSQVLGVCDYNHKLMMVLFIDLYHQNLTTKK
jgi:hypothetical protein